MFDAIKVVAIVLGDICGGTVELRWGFLDWQRRGEFFHMLAAVLNAYSLLCLD